MKFVKYDNMSKRMQSAKGVFSKIVNETLTLVGGYIYGIAMLQINNRLFINLY